MLHMSSVGAYCGGRLSGHGRILGGGLRVQMQNAKHIVQAPLAPGDAQAKPGESWEATRTLKAKHGKPTMQAQLLPADTQVMAEELGGDHRVEDLWQQHILHWLFAILQVDHNSFGPVVQLCIDEAITQAHPTMAPMAHMETFQPCPCQTCLNIRARQQTLDHRVC